MIKIETHIWKMIFEIFIVCFFRGTNKGSKFKELEFSANYLIVQALQG